MHFDNEVLKAYLHASMLLDCSCVSLTRLKDVLPSVMDTPGQFAHNPSAVTTCAAEATASSRVMVLLCIALWPVVDILQGL